MFNPPPLVLFLIPFLAALISVSLILPRWKLLAIEGNSVPFAVIFGIIHAIPFVVLFPTAVAVVVTSAVFIALGGGAAVAFLTFITAAATVILAAITACELGLLCLAFPAVKLTSVRAGFFAALIIVGLEFVLAIPAGYALYMVSSEKIWFGVIDKTGKFIVEPKSEERELRPIDSEDYGSNKFGVDGNPLLYEYHNGSQFGVAQSIDKNGLRMLPYSEGVALASSYANPGWGFVNAKEKFVIGPEAFDDARSFKDGLAAAAYFLDRSGARTSLGGSGAHWWGFVDHSGKWVIPPQFNRAESFSDGLACVGVQVDNTGKNTGEEYRYGYIDKSGKFVIPPMFHYANSFSAGKADAAINVNNRPAAGIAPEYLKPPKMSQPYLQSENMEQIGHWARAMIDSWRLSQTPAQIWDLKKTNEWLKWKPNDANMLAIRSVIFASQYPVAMAAAEKDARLAISYDKNCAVAHAVLGHILEIKGKHAEAVKEFTEAIKIEPKNSEWYANRGLAYEGALQYDKAISDYTKLIETEQDEWAFGERAHAHLSNNNNNPSAHEIDLGMQDIERVFKLNPDNTYAFKQRADAYYKKHEYEKAVKDLEAAEKLLDPHAYDMVEILDMEGYFYEMVHKPDKSKAARAKRDKLVKELNSANHK